jgi:NADH:ubiquinone reductase (H+-translocating)
MKGDRSLSPAAARAAPASASPPKPHVIILGGGFGGLYAAKALARVPARVTLLDRRNHHTFQPLLYQVATAGLNPADIAAPIRHVLRRQRNAEVLLADVSAIDPARKVVIFDDQEMSYDVLIVATGATHSYFGHDEWEAVAPGLKTLEDALKMRKRVFFAFEAAERVESREEQRAWLNFVVVGGGPTGVELAGTLVEIARKTLADDFRHIDPSEARILLLEGGPDILQSYVPSLRAKALHQLERLGVEVRTNARVTQIDELGVCVGDERIRSGTVLWAAGVAASPIGRSLGVPLDRAGRVLVNPDLTIPGHDDVYVIGDLAALTQDGAPVPGVAAAAIQGGRYVARRIHRKLRGESIDEPFRYHDKGSLATIGRAAAIADFGRVKLSGFLAWFAWLTIHIALLIGFRNRFFVMLEWAFAYLSYHRGARLITGDTPKLSRREPATSCEPTPDRTPS